MKFLDKVKNMFIYTEEVEEEVKEKKIAKKIELPKQEEIEEVETVSFRDSDLLKQDSKLDLFDEDDLLDDFVEDFKEEVVEKEFDTFTTNLYGGNTEIKTTYTKEEKKEFIPSPVISPVHGVLEANEGYKPNVEKRVPTPSFESKEADLDVIRNKAFGDLVERFGLEDKVMEEEQKEQEIEDNLLYNLTEDVVDETPRVETVTFADAEEYFEDLGLEYNIDYKDEAQEKATGRRTTKKINTDLEKDTFGLDDLKLDEDPVVKEEPKKEEVKEEEAKLDDDLFDLIDLMYESEED